MVVVVDVATAEVEFDRKSLEFEREVDGDCC